MSKIGKKGKQLKKRHTSKRMRLKKFKKKNNLSFLLTQFKDHFHKVSYFIFIMHHS